MQLTLYQVDAFTQKIFGGNPAAVCPLDDWLPDELMQAIAAENNLAETAFFVPQADQFGLRWFTPTVEVDLCGHATLATAHILYTELQYDLPNIGFNTRSGLLSVSEHASGYVMNFPADSITPIQTPPEIAEGLQLTSAETYRGKTDYLVVIDSQDQLEALQPDFRVLSKGDVRGTIVTAPGKNVDFVSRCFFPQSGIDEDPVTGSAHTTLTPYWAQRLGKKRLSAQQLSARKGELICTHMGDRVELIGSAVTYLKGDIWI
uniref:PhzF family phenazine biosynthesis protein n=1 Tax=Roseihalotalea indica TaxID=2867963 RepID=A0AA49GKT2_9BACT|nr:PhzF family phenazine biosynthesis protein [Tunicatimonas sp. TK19036]